MILDFEDLLFFGCLSIWWCFLFYLNITTMPSLTSIFPLWFDLLLKAIMTTCVFVLSLVPVVGFYGLYKYVSRTKEEIKKSRLKRGVSSCE